MTRFQRLAQTISLVIFLTLLYLAAHPFLEGSTADLFLKLDPLIGVGTAVAAREVHAYVLPGFLVLVAGLAFGRVFCGHICPMGTTIDLAQTIIGRAAKPSAKRDSFEATSAFRAWKYVLLAAILAAAIGGVSIVHLGSPLSLITRLYAIVLYPIALLVGDAGVGRLAVLAPEQLVPGLAYFEFPQKIFATNAFVAALFIGIMALAYKQPRFWCRNLCPAGALLGLFSSRPAWRRAVSESCSKCGRCVRECPTSAIRANPAQTVHSECIVCLRCTEICPESAVSFTRNRESTGIPALPQVSRRELLLGMGSGLACAGLLHTGIRQPRPQGKERPFVNEALIRPPGSLPEAEFLTHCIRCGECMKACPTNTLQPVWLTAGLEGIFSPVMTPRVGACATECHVCGQVCPTGAIRNIPLAEKKQAKVGTAWIVRQTCLVWEQDKKCLVCDEVCPYSAVSFKPVPGLKNAAPFVVENKCIGCGWCESRCPVEGAAAIRVNIIGEVRLSSGSYAEKAQEYGYTFKTKDKTESSLAPDTFDSGGGLQDKIEYPDSTGDTDSGLPPGFMPK